MSKIDQAATLSKRLLDIVKNKLVAEEREENESQPTTSGNAGSAEEENPAEGKSTEEP